jgi:hypothetical protein
MQAAASPIEYRDPFAEWERKSWIRSKPVREEPFDGAPFPARLVPLASSPAIVAAPEALRSLLAYRLLAHLQFTTTLELRHVNWVCAHLAQGQGPVPLTLEQRNDALRIYCDEGGHALFVELLSSQVERHFSVQREVLGRPAFDFAFEELLARHRPDLPEALLRLFFVSVSETLVTKILREIPQDPSVATLVRKVIGDHAADEGVHSIFFHWYFPRLWSTLSATGRRTMAQILPELVWVFLGPDLAHERRILARLGFAGPAADALLEESYQGTQVSELVRGAAQPTLRMFEAAGVFTSAEARDAFQERNLYVGERTRA